MGIDKEWGEVSRLDMLVWHTECKRFTAGDQWSIMSHPVYGTLTSKKLPLSLCGGGIVFFVEILGHVTMNFCF